MYINQAKCKQFLLEFAKQNRAHKFTRVSRPTLEQLDGKLRHAMITLVLAAPSKGKTL